MTGVDGRFLIISIDCLAESALSRAEIIAAQAMVDLFGEYRLPATWAIADPGADPGASLAQQLMTQQTGQRIALLAEPHWAGQQAGRTRFARELSRRLASASSTGTTVRSLALRNLKLRDHFDLLVRHRLAVVRSGIVRNPHRGGLLRISCSRFGTFEFDPNARLPWKSGFLGICWDSPRQLLARTQARGPWTHLLIDTPAWSRCGRGEWRRLRKFLAFVQRQIRAEKLRCVTAEWLVQHLQPERRSSAHPPSRHRAA